jgi:hypothetical protein
MFESLLVPKIEPCRMATFLEALDEGSRKNLETALSMPRQQVPHKRIARDIFLETSTDTAPGEKIDPETIAAHRNGTCRCSKI